MTNLVKELSQNALNNLQPNTKPAIPIHAAIIPDGNRRWARSKGWHAWVGHRIGMSNERFSELFDVCDNVGIKYLSFWGFSTENWDRSKQEIEFLWNIYRSSISKWTENLQKRNMRFIHAGRKDHLPEDIITNLAKLEETTKNNNGLTFLFCLDYGGRDEIARAVNKALKNNVKVFDIEKIRSYLDTGNIPDPDLIIRTGGEKRLSGFMAYQCAYSELYFTNTFFPDFAGKEFSLALADYSKRIRRFGGDSAKDLLNIDTSKLFDPKYDHLQS
jgi:undecaprenyl diphosphate synthase